MNTTHGFLIAAPQSGSGKTTISLAIMAALVRRGFVVAPFKCGPDFIDPGYHCNVTGRPSINLDAWMCPEDFVRETFFARLSGGAGQEIAVIEGAMGLFDGIGASSREGSSAQIAAITGAPVVLVVNARGMASSAAALVKGFACFDPDVRLAGVIFNNIGSPHHAALLKEALGTHCPDISCFGCIPRDESLSIPSRHLGLVTAEDNPLSEEFIERLVEMAERCLDLDQLSKLRILPSPPFIPGATKGNSPVRIAVARDPAFCFLYEDNLRLLQDAGAECAFFSPLRDTELPADIHGIYLPGGYPELYAAQLAENESMKESLRRAVKTDVPVYAECGGFIYLTEGLDKSDHQPSADFVGIFPVRCRMLPQRKTLGYRQAELTQNVSIGLKGAVVRGHEFHYSEIGTMPEEVERCYQVSRQAVAMGLEGFRVRNCLASYIHVHFGSNRSIAGSFVNKCRKQT
ncbi:MAG: cobyrinate a,c-diamide synthase [Desulfuromonadaceae bacterium]|nr:cobyrinate a,c-diamide synthase [Desulfuromonadaceae bacterium]